MQPGVLGLEDDAHAAAAEHPHEPIGAEHRARAAGRAAAARRASAIAVSAAGVSRNPSAPVVGGEQRRHLAPHLVGGVARRVSQAARVSTRLAERPREQLPDLRASVRGVMPAPSSAFLRNARASVQWRLTVAGESSTAAAVSSTVRPPK